MLCTVKRFFLSLNIHFIPFIYLFNHLLLFNIQITYCVLNQSNFFKMITVLSDFIDILSSHNKLYFRKRHEAEQSESYETWLANKETEKKTVTLAPVPPSIPGPSVAPKPVEMNTSERSQEPERADGYLRTYLRSLDDRKRGNSYFCYEQWLDEKEETVLGLQRQKTAMA